MSLPPPLPCCTAGSDAAWTGPAIPAGTGTAGSQSFAGARLSVTKASVLTAPHSLKEGNGEDRNLASRALAGTHRPPAQGLPINWVSHQECPLEHLVSCLSSLLRQMGMTEGQLPPGPCQGAGDGLGECGGPRGPVVSGEGQGGSPGTRGLPSARLSLCQCLTPTLTWHHTPAPQALALAVSSARKPLPISRCSACWASAPGSPSSPWPSPARTGFCAHDVCPH